METTTATARMSITGNAYATGEVPLTGCVMTVGVSMVTTEVVSGTAVLEEGVGEGEGGRGVAS